MCAHVRMYLLIVQKEKNFYSEMDIDKNKRIGLTDEQVKQSREQHTFRGRTDITMETKDTIYVIELKFNKSAQEALDQINNKHYADAFALRGKNVEKIGMNFMIDEDKTIVLDWWKFGE